MAHIARHIALHGVSCRILRREPLRSVFLARGGPFRVNAHTRRLDFLVHRPLADPLFRCNAEHIQQLAADVRALVLFRNTAHVALHAAVQHRHCSHHHRQLRLNRERTRLLGGLPHRAWHLR